MGGHIWLNDLKRVQTWEDNIRMGSRFREFEVDSEGVMEGSDSEIFNFTSVNMWQP
jgi:hypothetical protein